MLALLGAGALAALHPAAPPPTVYRDPAGRFSFTYPESFGATSKGTDDGFGDRLAAVRFASFPARLGGEAVLTRGFPLIDLQAAGGLYDGITLQVFPDALRQRVINQLPPLTPGTFCGALAAAQHLDPNLPAFASLTPAQRNAIASADRMRNANIHVLECRVDGNIVVFDKSRTAAANSPDQHVYGAVRFLMGPYTTFQLVAGGGAPDAATLEDISEVVRSFTSTMPHEDLR
jgi:hypothetical protein